MESMTVLEFHIGGAKMRRLIYAAILGLWATRSGAVSSSVIQVESAPDGSCASSIDPMQIVHGTGELWSCISNTWTKLPRDPSGKLTPGTRNTEQFSGPSIAAQVAAASADCGAGQPCTIVIPSSDPSGAWNAATLQNGQSVIDYRSTDRSNPWDQAQPKSVEETTATSLDHTRTSRRYPVGFSWTTRFLAGGVNRNDAIGAKDHYEPFSFTTIDFGENEGSNFLQRLVKNGRGDAFGASFMTSASNNCMDGGDECSAALTGALQHNPYIPTAVITSATAASPGTLVTFDSGFATSWVGQSRLVINVRKDKIFSTGTISGMTKGPVKPFAPYGDPSIADSDATVVKGSTTGWSALCKGSTPCDGTNWCFELVPDRLAIDLEADNVHYYESAPGKLVYPIRKILSDTELQLNPQMQGYLENYLGPGTSGAYRIYPCGSIYEVKSLLNNGQSPDSGTLQITGNSKGWSAGDRIEVPHPYANWGSVLKLYGQHFMDGMYGSEMITVYDHVDRGWPPNKSAPRTYRPFSAIVGGSGEFTYGLDFWGMLFDNSVMRSTTGDIVFGERCNHTDGYTDAQCIHREKRNDGAEIPPGYANQRQSEYYYYTYENPKGTLTGGSFHLGPYEAYTYAADAAAAKNTKPRLDVSGLEVYTNGSIATGGASGTADTSIYIHAPANAYGLQMNLVDTTSTVFPLVVMRNGTQKLEFSCGPGASADCDVRFRHGTEISVEDSDNRERARLGNGFVNVGATPAKAGAVRLTNNEAVTARDSDNATDVNLARLDASNVVELGDAAHVVYVPSLEAGSGLRVGQNGNAIAQILAGSVQTTSGTIANGTHGTVTASVRDLPLHSACSCSPREDFHASVIYESCSVASAGTLTVKLFNSSASKETAAATTADYFCAAK
jgi:hypothetical protein